MYILYIKCNIKHAYECFVDFNIVKEAMCPIKHYLQVRLGYVSQTGYHLNEGTE